MLFNVNVNEADRMILAEEERRRELINDAVDRFAPHLDGKPGVQVIHLHSSNAALRTILRDEFTGANTFVVEHCFAGKKPRHGIHEVTHDGMVLPLPDKADLVATKTGLTSGVEWLAARLGAQACVLPEALDYIRALLERKGALVIVGGEQAK